MCFPQWLIGIIAGHQFATEYCGLGQLKSQRAYFTVGYAHPVHYLYDHTEPYQLAYS